MGQELSLVTKGTGRMACSRSHTETLSELGRELGFPHSDPVSAAIQIQRTRHGVGLSLHRLLLPW